MSDKEEQVHGADVVMDVFDESRSLSEEPELGEVVDNKERLVFISSVIGAGAGLGAALATESPIAFLPASIIAQQVAYKAPGWGRQIMENLTEWRSNRRFQRGMRIPEVSELVREKEMTISDWEAYHDKQMAEADEVIADLEQQQSLALEIIRSKTDLNSSRDINREMDRIRQKREQQRRQNEKKQADRRKQTQQKTKHARASS